MAVCSLLLVVACFAGWRYGYRPWAAERDRIAKLKSEAEILLASGDLEAAELKVAALKEAGIAAMAEELRVRCEDLERERERNRRRAEVSAAYKGCALLSRGQAFGMRLDALETTWQEAETAWQDRRWDQTLDAYGKVLADSKVLQELDLARQAAVVEQNRVARLRLEAKDAGADADAQKDWAAGMDALSQADGAFERGAFPVALTAWTRAGEAFVQARSEALAVQKARKAAEEARREALAERDKEDPPGPARQDAAPPEKPLFPLVVVQPGPPDADARMRPMFERFGGRTLAILPCIRQGRECRASKKLAAVLVNDCTQAGIPCVDISGALTAKDRSDFFDGNKTLFAQETAERAKARVILAVLLDIDPTMRGKKMQVLGGETLAMDTTVRFCVIAGSKTVYADQFKETAGRFSDDLLADHAATIVIRNYLVPKCPRIE